MIQEQLGEKLERLHRGFQWRMLPSAKLKGWRKESITGTAAAAPAAAAMGRASAAWARQDSLATRRKLTYTSALLIRPPELQLTESS